MTTYKNTTYETSEALREAINLDLAQLEYPYSVKHKVYGEGQLTFVKAPSMGGDLYVTIDFAEGTKIFALGVVLANRLLYLPIELMEELLDIQAVFKEDFETREREQREAKCLELIQAREAEKKAAEDKKNAEKYEATKAKAIKDFEARSQAESTLSTADEFYYSLGWLTKNAVSLSAAMPDYLLSYFEQHFGTAYKPTIVDSKKRTVNGYAMQWAMSMKAAISSKASNMPAYLTKHLSQNGKHLADTSFIWDLVDNYGFQFGKKQDLDKIRSHVPSEYLASFEAGLA